VHTLGDGKQKNLVQFPIRARDSSPPQHPRPALGPTKTPIQLAPRTLHGG